MESAAVANLAINSSRLPSEKDIFSHAEKLRRCQHVKVQEVPKRPLHGLHDYGSSNFGTCGK